LTVTFHLLIDQWFSTRGDSGCNVRTTAGGYNGALERIYAYVILKLYFKKKLLTWLGIKVRNIKLFRPTHVYTGKTDPVADMKVLSKL
jgi:hypothetical protein